MKSTTIAVVSAGTLFTGICGAYILIYIIQLSPFVLFCSCLGSRHLTFFIAYAIYFDHRRRTDPEFRKALRRESRRQARAVKEEAEAYGARHKEAVKAAVAKAKEEGFPTDVEQKEAFFMNEVARGEALGSDGNYDSVPWPSRLAVCLSKLVLTHNPGSDSIDAALCFYKALKVYPNPRDLISIYDKTVAKVSFDSGCDVLPFLYVVD